MNNKPFIVGPRGAAVMDAVEAWEHYARSHNLGSTASMIGRSKKERDKYYAARDEWIAVWLLENYGYDYASHYVELNCTNNIDVRDKFASIMFCKYDECNIFCKRFEKCVKEGFVINAVN